MGVAAVVAAAVAVADVSVAELEDTIEDVLIQMSGVNKEPSEWNPSGIGSGPSELETKCAILREELSEVLLELETPKVSDQCD